MIKAVKRGATLTRSVARGLWSDGGSLGQKAVRGGIWVLGSGTVILILGTVQTIILVRLLVPDDFGVMRVTGFVLAAIATFTATGMGAAIIQRKEVSRETLDTAWSIGIIRNMGLFLAVFSVAPCVARFYQNPLTSPILRLVSVRFLPDRQGRVAAAAGPGTLPATEASPPESQ